MQSTVHVIRFPKNGNIMGLRHINKSYIVGFPLYKHAEMIQKNVNISVELEFSRYFPVSISQLVKENINGHDSEVWIDEDANLLIPKTRINNDEPSSLGMIDELKIEDVLSYPFTYNVGVVMATNIAKDTSEAFTFDVNVIMPFDDPKMFRVTSR